MTDILVEKNNVVNLINCVNFKLGISRNITKIDEADVKLIKESYDKICKSPTFMDDNLDDVSIIKKILDDLSLSFGVSLAHIEPNLIVTCDKMAVQNLFEVFSELISIDMLSQSEKTRATENDVLHLLNFIFEVLNMDENIASISEVNSWLFKSIFRHLNPSSMAATPFKNNDEEGNYSALLKNVSRIIEVPLTNINIPLLVNKDPSTIWKFIEIIVGIREGYFSSEKILEMKKFEAEVIQLANEVLKLFELKSCINEMYEVNEDYFWNLLERFLGRQLEKVVRSPTSDEERSRNMARILDILSREVLDTPLGHISPLEVVSGNHVSVKYLLEIFRGMTLCRAYAGKCAVNVERKISAEASEGERVQSKRMPSGGVCRCNLLSEYNAGGMEVGEMKLPTIKEVMKKFGPKRDKKCADKKSLERMRKETTGNRTGRLSFSPSEPRGKTDDYDEVEYSDVEEDDVEILRKNINRFNLDDYAEETVRQHKKVMDDCLQKEFKKSKEINDMIGSMRRVSYPKMAADYNRAGCYNRCRQTATRTERDRYMKCIAGKLMSYLMEEYPSIDIPCDVQRKILKSFLEKEDFDVDLRTAQSRRNKKTLREKKCQQSRAKAVIRNRKILSNQLRKHCEDVRATQRAKDLRKKSCYYQEQQRIHKEKLSLRRDSLAEERREKKERRQEEARRQVLELESIENYYRDQFAMLNEDMQKEKALRCQRDQEHARLMREMKMEMRRNMEEEIEQLQDKLVRGGSKRIAMKNNNKLIC